MKVYFLLLLLLPIFIFSQSKKKRALAEKLANANLVANLQLHTKSIALDSTFFTNYLVSQFNNLGLLQNGESGYLDPFIINNGKIIKSSSLVVAKKEAVLYSDYFPLSYSGAGSIKTFAAMSMNEPGNCLFKDVKDWLEETESGKINTDSALKKCINKSVAKKATALFVYNNSKLDDSIYFNKMDTSKTAAIPVFYITKKGVKSLFFDKAATQPIEASVSIVDNLAMGFNIIFFLDNHSTNTTIISNTDRASGEPVMIELARKLSMSHLKNSNFMFVNFYNNDSAKLGSSYFFNNHFKNIKANYILEIGDVSSYSNKLLVDIKSSDSILNKSIVNNHYKNIALVVDSSNKWDDSSNFLKTPYISFHTESTKTNPTINYQGEMEIVNYLYSLITSISKNPSNTVK